MTGSSHIALSLLLPALKLSSLATMMTHNSLDTDTAVDVMMKLKEAEEAGKAHEHASYMAESELSPVVLQCAMNFIGQFLWPKAN